MRKQSLLVVLLLLGKSECIERRENSLFEYGPSQPSQKEERAAQSMFEFEQNPDIAFGNDPVMFNTRSGTFMDERDENRDEEYLAINNKFQDFSESESSESESDVQIRFIDNTTKLVHDPLIHYLEKKASNKDYDQQLEQEKKAKVYTFSQALENANKYVKKFKTGDTDSDEEENVQTDFVNPDYKLTKAEVNQLIKKTHHKQKVEQPIKPASAYSFSEALDMVSKNKEFVQTEFIDEDGMLTTAEKNQLFEKICPRAVEPEKQASEYTESEALNFFLTKKNQKKQHKRRHHHVKKEESEDEE